MPASANGIGLITLATDCGNAPSGMYAAAIKPVAVPTTVFSAELALLLRTNDTMNAHNAVNAAQHSSVSAPIRTIVAASSQSPETSPRYTTLTAITTADMTTATTIADNKYRSTKERCLVGETRKSRKRPDSPSSISTLKAPRPVVTVAMRTMPANIHESTKANT